MTAIVWADEYASGMTGLRRFMTRQRPRICPFDVLAHLVPAHSHVLDIGCGSGLLLYILWRGGKLSLGQGVDIDSRAVNSGAEALGHVSHPAPITLQSRSDPKTWPPGPFDVVTMVDVLHHVPPPLTRDVLIAAMERVGPRGLFVYKDMASRPLWGACWNRLHDLAMANQWINYVNPETVVAAARDAGMGVVERRDLRLLAYHHQFLVFQRQ